MDEISLLRHQAGEYMKILGRKIRAKSPGEDGAASIAVRTHLMVTPDQGFFFLYLMSTRGHQPFRLEDWSGVCGE